MTSAPLAARLTQRPADRCSSPSPRTAPTAPSTSTSSAPMCAAGVDAGAAAVFACCGTGEFHALTPEEFQALRRARPSRRRPGGCRSSPAPATAPRSPSGTRGSPRRRARTGCSPCRRISSSPTRRGCCGTTPSSPRPPRSTSSSTSATTPSSPRRPSSNWPAPTASSASRTGYGDLDLMQRIVSAVRAEVPGGLPLLQRAADRRTHRARLPRHRRHALLLRRLLLRPRDRPRLPPGAGRPATTRPSNRLLDGFYRPFVELRDPGPRLRRRRWSRRAYGCAGWTSGRSGRRCTSRAERPCQAARRAHRARPRAAGRSRSASEGRPPSSTPGTSSATRTRAAPHRRPRRPAGHARLRLPLHARPDPPPPPAPHRHRRARGRALPAGRRALGGPRAAPVRGGGLGARRRVRRGRRRARGRRPRGPHLGGPRPQLPPGRRASGRPRWSTPTATATPGRPASPSPPCAPTWWTSRPRRRYGPGARGTELESCGWYGLAHLHAHDKTARRARSATREQYLMSLCFCPTCREGYGEAGRRTPTSWRRPCGGALEPVWAGRRPPAPAIERLLGADRRCAWRDADRPHAPGVRGRRGAGRRPARLPGAAARRPGCVPLRRERRRRPGPCPLGRGRCRHARAGCPWPPFAPHAAGPDAVLAANFGVVTGMGGRPPRSPRTRSGRRRWAPPNSASTTRVWPPTPTWRRYGRRCGRWAEGWADASGVRLRRDIDTGGRPSGGQDDRPGQAGDGQQRQQHPDVDERHQARARPPGRSRSERRPGCGPSPPRGPPRSPAPPAAPPSSRRPGPRAGPPRSACSPPAPPRRVWPTWRGCTASWAPSANSRTTLNATVRTSSATREPTALRTRSSGLIACSAPSRRGRRSRGTTTSISAG